MNQHSDAKRKAWQTALDDMLEEETRYFEFTTEDHTEEEIQSALNELHKVRQAFWDIADNLIVVRSQPPKAPAESG